MFFRLFKYAVKNILRNTFLSISSILILTLLMFFINILVVLHSVSIKLIDGVNDKLTISLYLQEDYNKNSLEVIDLLSDIKNNVSGVQASYKTKEEVLEEIRDRDPELVRILEKENPLPETITLKNIKLEQYENLNAIIENKMFILQTSEADSRDYFSSYTAQYDRIVNVISVLSTLQVGLYIIIVIFLVSILVIVYSIIGNFIFYYRDEIYITRLVWGSKFFIYGPFSLQGILYCALAFIISTSFFLFFVTNVQYLLAPTLSGALLEKNIYIILLGEALLFMMVGGLWGYLSSRRYLKK